MLVWVLMVVSVCGATVAMSGAAAAASGPSVGNVSPGTVDEETTESNQQITFEVSTYSEDGNSDTVSLVFPDRYENNLSANSAVTNDPDGVAQSISLVDGPDGDGVQDTLQFELADDGSDDSLPLEVGVDTGIDYPDVSSDTNLPVRFVFEDTNGDNIDQTFDTVFIQNDASADADLVVPTNGNNNTNFEDIAFQGQIVVGTNFNPGETVNVRRVTDSGDQLVREESADSTGEVTLDHAELGHAVGF